MSQYGSMPPPGAYAPPNQGPSVQGYNEQQQQQQQGFPQTQVSNPGAPGHPHKAGGMFGKYMNEAVTTGKPMLNKLSKTISSKLGGKPQTGPPQHLQSYQNYQNQQGPYGQSQGYQQPPGQSFSPQPQQQQWGQPQQPQQPQQQPQGQAPNAFVSPQQSPYPQSNYATPASGHSGQSNYFAQQTGLQQGSQSQTSQQPPNIQGYEGGQFGQGGHGVEQQMPAQQGQFGQGQQGQQPQSPFQQEQHLQGQYPGQQIGVVGGVHSPPPSQTVQTPYQSHVSPVSSVQPTQQQWNNVSPASPPGPGQNPGQPAPHSISPPPPQQANPPPQILSNKPPLSHPPTPATQHAVPQAAPTAFIAELPADMGNLSIMESKPPVQDQSGQGSQYQAYHPAGSHNGSPSPAFTIPRRSVSTGSFPTADPWRIADPVTEVPTREFYIIADLVFDALDRKLEPYNTGLLEAPKVLGSWMTLTDEARRLFSYKSYSALAKLWSLEGIPHIMVPSQSALTPNWNFNQHGHAQDLKILAEPPSQTSTYATYIPAINRAGWYKFFFLETLHAPEVIGDLLRGLCPDTYKPGVLNHPDVNRRDRSEIPALQARASEIQSFAFKRVCDETKHAMAADGSNPGA